MQFSEEFVEARLRQHHAEREEYERELTADIRQEVSAEVLAQVRRTYHKKGGLKKYPWRTLAVGEQFLVECPPWERERVHNSLTSCRYNAEKKTGFKFGMSRRNRKGVLIWRES